MLHATGTDLSAVITRPAADDSQLDLFAQPLDVRTGSGPDDVLTLTLDPSSGPITRLEGQLDVDVAGFFQVSGGSSLNRRKTR